jgi:acetyl-CoA acetyltransferase
LIVRCFGSLVRWVHPSKDVPPADGHVKCRKSSSLTTTLWRRFVTNRSGGQLSRGHPLGATGLAQCYEFVHQLRGTAEARQVDGARPALQHNLGLGGATVVTLYEKN